MTAQVSQPSDTSSPRPSHVIRTPDQRLRVFVSSTLVELADEREAVKEAIRKLRLIPVMFELGARPHPPRDLYRAYLEQSHIFLGIYWQRYGWVAPDMTISGLEDEYRLSGTRPKLIYVKTDGSGREPRLETLLEQIIEDSQASFRPFSTADELQELVENDLALLLSERFEISGTEIAQPATRPRSSLPVPATPLVGRVPELDSITDLLTGGDVRLVTLVGPGGIGKTRLSLEVASRLKDRFEDGVHFVPLSSVTDPAMVAPAIAVGLGVSTRAGRPLLEAIASHLEGKRVLLVLDNFEQVTDAAVHIAELLRFAPGLHVLATSRTLLHVSGEHAVDLPPLSLPGRRDRSPFEELTQSEAVRLFSERARAVKPDFVLSVENTLAVAEICHRLDGLPLAIELAAARLTILSPEDMLKRLDRRLGFLVRGHRDLPERQQTLRNTLDWSYNLLNEEDRSLFARLSIFVGGCTLETAEAVCSEALPDVLGGLASLIDKSLLRLSGHTAGESRFVMLTTVREYAREQLEARGELEALRRRRAEHFVELVRDARSGLNGVEQASWVVRLDAEYGNLRAVMRWALINAEDDLATEVAFSLYSYWWATSRFADVYVWMQELLHAPRRLEPLARARALALFHGMGVTAMDRGEGAVPGLEESLQLFREAGDHRGVAIVLVLLGLTWLTPPHVQIDDADACFSEAFTLFEAQQNNWGIAVAMTSMARIALTRRDATRARAIYEQGLAQVQARGDKLAISLALYNLGGASLLEGNLARAEELLRQSLESSVRIGNRLGIAYTLRTLAGVAAERDDADRAARLLGAGTAVLERFGGRTFEANYPYHQEPLERLQERVDPDVFAERKAEGMGMHVDEAVAYALGSP